MKSFRTLELAVEFYGKVQGLQVEKHLRDQLLRSSSSIALNLSEGNAKGTAKDKRSYFQTAYGSLRECQTIFKLARIEDKELNQMADQLGAYLYKLVNSDIKSAPNWR